jgi:branched-chain amino acid transport system ATP-binding protein
LAGFVSEGAAVLLRTEGLTKRFGGLQAVSEFDMSLETGEIVGLIGPNGAGKTTVFNLLTGASRPTKGKVFFEDLDITGRKPHSIAALGMVRTFQITNIFSNFTVRENLALACNLKAGISYWGSAFHTRKSRGQEREVRQRCEEILETVGLQSVEDLTAGTLAHGHKNLLGIAIALAAEPKLLLLDEPLAGMNAHEVREALSVIRGLWENGTSILVIEHNMKAAMSLCGRLVVISFGKKIAEGTPEEIRANTSVIEAYLGDDTYVA